MAVFVLFMLILALVDSSGATWCVCRSDVSDSVLQKTIDYACGAGADCTPILSSGACYQPNTVRSHCSYAANSYFQRKGQVQGSCDFSGTATISTTDPSYSGCSYPASSSTAGTSPTSSTPGTPTTPTTPGTPTTTTPNTNSPFGGGTSTTNGGGGVLGTGLGPSGTTISPDGSDGGILLSKLGFIMGCSSLFLTTFFTAILKCWI